jgi:hypothetical protein
MTQRVRDRLALSLIADGAAMAAAGNHDLPPLSLLDTTTVAAPTDIGTQAPADSRFGSSGVA